MPVDRHGREVKLGSLVRVVGLPAQWLADLPADERINIVSMIGGIYEVDEIDAQGRAWVTKFWPNGDEIDGSGVALESREMELVE